MRVWDGVNRVWWAAMSALALWQVGWLHGDEPLVAAVTSLVAVHLVSELVVGPVGRAVTKDDPSRDFPGLTKGHVRAAERAVRRGEPITDPALVPIVLARTAPGTGPSRPSAVLGWLFLSAAPVVAALYLFDGRPLIAALWAVMLVSHLLHAHQAPDAVRARLAVTRRSAEALADPEVLRASLDETVASTSVTT